MKISIITVGYNCEDTVTTTIDSVSSQKDVDLEYIFIDGSSKDSTIVLVQKRKEVFNHIVSEPDEGIYDAINKGINLSNGDIIGLLNSDDFYPCSNILNTVVSLFQLDKSLDAIMGGIVFVSNENLSLPLRKIKSVNFKPWMLRFGFMPPHPAIFIRKSAYDKVGLYKSNYKIAADFEFLLRLLLIYKLKYKMIDSHLVTMRVGGISTSNWQVKNKITQEMLEALKSNNIFSCRLFLWIRFPIKYFKQVIF